MPGEPPSCRRRGSSTSTSGRAAGGERLLARASVGAAAAAAGYWSSVRCGLLLALLAACSCVQSCAAADASQAVEGLPGQPPVSFRHFAGHVTVNASHGRALFYWFFESPHPRAASLPLVLWLNGGPGCSSVGNGALAELGPFFPDSSANGLVLNPHTWTKAANIIFLESPYGTGFSYSNTSSDYHSFADQPIAEDAHAFLVGWFGKFPEYRSNEFYLAGESYGGHYLPTLARVIVRENKSPNGFNINFKGFAVGNPWSDAYSDNSGTTNYYFTHSLISEETYDSINKYCDFQNLLPVDSDSKSKACNAAVEQADLDMTKIDIYNIYGLSCNKNSSSSYKKVHKAFFPTGSIDPCLDAVTPYLNNLEVQSALHVDIPTNWSGCSGKVFDNYTKSDILQSMIPVYQELLKEGLRIWVYSGDNDGVVSTAGTRKWIRKLNLPIDIPWYAWDYNNQVGGWAQVYKGLTFVTVRGAGHLVPAIKPGPALALFRSFIAGKPLPKFS